MFLKKTIIMFLKKKKNHVQMCYNIRDNNRKFQI